MAEESQHVPFTWAPSPVIETYKKDVDRTLLRENLKLTVEERLTRGSRYLASVKALRRSVGRTSDE